MEEDDTKTSDGLDEFWDHYFKTEEGKKAIRRSEEIFQKFEEDFAKFILEGSKAEEIKGDSTVIGGFDGWDIVPDWYKT